MAKIKFKKMHGSGNDFILIDNRDGQIRYEDAKGLAERLCRRKYNIGADGLILIEDSQKASFKWRFFNADGSEAEMCGNGGRCAARFAYLSEIAPNEMSFETIAGIIHARVTDSRVKLELSRPWGTGLDVSLFVDDKSIIVHHINTGVPHAVVFCADLEHAPVVELGRKIRWHEMFQPAGTNVNFVKVADKGKIFIRTYERGVEDETLACGTGSVASAIIAALKNMCQAPVSVVTRGGEELRAYFSLKEQEIRDVYLEGNAVSVYSGILDEG